MTTLTVRTRDIMSRQAVSARRQPGWPQSWTDTPVEDPLPQGRTLADFLTIYEAEYLPHQAPNTQKRKRSQFRLFRRTLGDVPLDALSPQRLRLWRDALARQSAPGTVAQHLATLSGVLQVAVDDYEWLARNPIQRVRMPPPAEARVRFLTAEEQERLLRACQESPCRFLYPLVLLAMTTGARKTECLMLKWTDIDLDQGIMRLARTKTRLRRGVPIPQITCEALRAWRAEVSSAYAFPGRTQPPDINRRWYWARDRAGLHDVRFHDLRHTCASYLSLSGVRLEDIAEILGHTNLATTRIYRHTTVPYTAALVEKMAGQFVVRLPLPAPPPLPTFDASKYELGRLCRRGHAWADTGHSLRRKGKRDCLRCVQVAKRARASIHA